MSQLPTLSRRALTMLVSLTVLLLLSAGLWIIFQNEQNYREGRQNAAQIQGEILAASVTAALDFQDQAAAQESTDALRVSPQTLAAGVYDSTGSRFAGYARSPTLLPTRFSDIRSSDSVPIQVTVPVMRSGTRIGTVFLAGDIEPLSRRIARYAMIVLLVVMTSLILAVLGYGQAALRRVNQTLAEANRELQFQMEERSRTEQQLREAQKMQALGKLTGGVAHDFNNLLTVIQGSAEMLQRPGLSEDRHMRFTKTIIDASAQGALLTGQLLAFARRQPLKPELLDLNTSILKMLVMLQPTLGPNIILNTHLEKALLPVEVDPGQFEAALLNIVVNARDAMPDGGEVTIRTRNATPEEAEGRERAVVVAIEDSGIGIAPDQLAHVFEPFFTTKVIGKGTGLGLSQVYGFAAQSGGEARIDSVAGKGTTLSMLLPASKKPLPQRAPTARPLAAQKNCGRVLLVEDNDEVGDLAESLLGELGHAVVRARNGPEALNIADEGDQFDIVFSDVVMPGMSGLELASALQSRRPKLPIILTTGHSDRIIAAGSQGFPVVRKPYRMETLAVAVDEAMATALH
ncbi:ATP-binding protein [Rhizorhabdus argentea]|uniref:ATP-binding protein n=1 Tax=Rhizorhabdus argentea TaxID=1387174 RepID=UPI0030EC5D01